MKLTTKAFNPQTTMKLCILIAGTFLATVGTGFAQCSITITTQPTNQTCCPGMDATFTVGATGTEPLFYQWQKSVDGVNWVQVGFNGFGDPNNLFVWPPYAVATDKDDLYIGTYNWANGGEIWIYLDNSIYLPVLIR